MSLLFILGFIFVLSLNSLSLTESIAPWLHTLYYLFWILFYYAYFLRKGQTPAMHIWRMHFMNEKTTSSQLSTKQILIRLIVGVFTPIAWLTCFFNQEKKSAIDYLSHSRLVRREKL